MSEVLLSVKTPASPDTLEAAMRRRRWLPVPGSAGWFRCPFEHGFMDELRALVRGDLDRALRGEAYRAAFAHASEPARVVDVLAASLAAPVEGPWRDPGASVPDGSLLGDVMLGVNAEAAAVLVERGWRRLEGTDALAHGFDLRMFDAIDARVEADLAWAAERLARSHTHAVWAMSTHRVARLESRAARPARRRLPWD